MKFYSGSNRIDAAIERQQARIDALIEGGVDLKGQPIAPSLANMDATMALTAKEHADFQNQQSRAAATKVIITQVVSDLLSDLLSVVVVA